MSEEELAPLETLTPAQKRAAYAAAWRALALTAFTGDITAATTAARDAIGYERRCPSGLITQLVSSCALDFEGDRLRAGKALAKLAEERANEYASGRYPQYPPAEGDALASIDAGVDDMPLTIL